MMKSPRRLATALVCFLSAASAFSDETARFDVVIVGGTPGGIMAAVATARGGHSAVILDRNRHIGGLPANGLGATDIQTRGATAGLFLEFVGRIKRHYLDTYGPDSPQVKDCSDGYHFEPSVAEKIFEQMLAEHQDKITVLPRRQFDAKPENVTLVHGAITQITVTHRDTREIERYAGKVFLDATYEGDLAAAAGVPFRIGREAHDELNEPMAGRLYKHWGGQVGPGSTGEADQAVQAYNFRLCLTRNPDDMVPIPKPESYNRDEYVSLIDDVKLGRTTREGNQFGGEMDFQGIGRVVNMVKLPNEKTDANNQHAAFISTDLPEENWPWPTADWQWRDRYAQRLRDYTLGLLWFAQHEPELPDEFRRRCLAWGLAKSEYVDNGHFPRQVYVREGRRIEGEYLFTAHDALSKRFSPEHAASITASHYALDSHAVRKREPGRVHLDGFFSYPTRPYSVPYGVIVPKKVDGLLIPVPVSGTHVGFSTLRMEPCWMALGQAAGTAACLAIEQRVPPRKIDVAELQRRLLAQGAVLVYFQDARPGDAHFKALQYFALRGFFPSSHWQAKLDDPVAPGTASDWIQQAGVGQPPAYLPGKTTRGQLLDMLFEFKQSDHDQPTSTWKRVSLPDVGKPGAAGVLDLANGDTIAIVNRDAPDPFAELDQGDFCCGRDGRKDYLWCIRGAKAMQFDGKPLASPPFARQETFIGYRFPPLPCRLLITTGENQHFVVNVLAIPETGGAILEYRRADPTEVPNAPPAKSYPPIEPSMIRPDGLIESRVLMDEFGNLLADAAAARKQAGDPMPEGWDTPQFLPKMIEEFKQRDPKLFLVTVEQEKRLEKAEVDEIAICRQFAGTMLVLDDFNADLPWLCIYVLRQFDAGWLRGARLELAARLILTPIAKQLDELDGDRMKGTEERIRLLRQLELRKRTNQRQQAEAAITTLSRALETYRLDIGEYPRTAQGLGALVEPPANFPEAGKWSGPYVRGPLPMDPWEAPYRYLAPGKRNPEGFDLWSAGPDGINGTQDDVTN